MKDKDISRQTLVVLVFLAIIVSLLGTFTVLQEIDSAEVPVSIQEEGTNVGTAKLYITKPQMDSQMGTATLEITKQTS